jgi:hypothetical protein
VGILPLKIDGDNTNFWLGNQQTADTTIDPYQYKEQELKNVHFLHKMTSDLA